jgi:hypothetical protein
MRAVKLEAPALPMRSARAIRLVTFIFALLGALLVGISYAEGHPGVAILGSIVCLLNLILYVRMVREP